MNFKIDLAAFLSVLPTALLGWLGVFIVTAVIIGVIWALNRFTGKRDQN